MVKGRYVPRANVLLDHEQRETIHFLWNLKNAYRKIVGYEVDGPYVEPGGKPGGISERIDPIIGYCLGLPYAHVHLSVDQTIENQHLRPFQNRRKIKKAIRDLEQRLGIKVITTIDSMKELDLYSSTND